MTKARLFVIDDEVAIRKSLLSVLSTYGFAVDTFATAEAALTALGSLRPDCLIVDVRMPGIDGLTLQRMIAESSFAPPVILITGHGDVSMAVRAMKNGAFDFVEKPVDDEKLVDSIHAAISSRTSSPSNGPSKTALMELYGSLTNREKTIADMVSDGYSSLAISSTLGISSRTVDHHRASILAKMQATSLPQLLRFLLVARG